MNRQRDIFQRRTHLNRQRHLSDQVGGSRTDDMSTHDESGRFLGYDLHETVGRIHRLARPLAHKELAAYDLNALFFASFAQAYRCDLGIGEADARHNFIVDGTRLTSDDFSCNLAFVGCFVSKCRAFDDITDRINVRDVRAALLVDFDQAALRHLDADRIKSDVVGVRTAAYGDKDIVSRNLLLLSVYRIRNRDFIVGLVRLICHRTGDDFDIVFLQISSYKTRQIRIEARQNRGGSLPVR